MKIAIGADHRGYHHKQYIMQQIVLPNCTIEWIDVGAFDQERTDYPPFAQAVSELVQKGTVERGVLICGSGVGMAIVANRFTHVYAALVWHEEVARIAREHDGVNVLVLPSDFVSPTQSVAMLTAWLNAPFLGERYQARLAMIDRIGGVDHSQL